MLFMIMLMQKYIYNHAYNYIKFIHAVSLTLDRSYHIFVRVGLDVY